MAIAQKAVSQVQSVVDLVKAEKDKAVAAGDLATQAGADAKAGLDTLLDTLMKAVKLPAYCTAVLCTVEETG